MEDKDRIVQNVNDGTYKSESFKQPSEHGIRQITVREMLANIANEKKTAEQKSETDKNKKQWKMPFSWFSKMGKAQKTRDMVVVFYLNIKGEMEQPMLLPLYSGNMVIIRNKVYEVDPRAFWTYRKGMKTWKLLLIKEIDRRPVSNLDWDEIKARGDATDSDEFLIKAALRAQTAISLGGMSKTALILIILGIVGIVCLFLFAG